MSGRGKPEALQAMLKVSPSSISVSPDITTFPGGLISEINVKQLSHGVGEILIRQFEMFTCSIIDMLIRHCDGPLPLPPGLGICEVKPTKLLILHCSDRKSAFLITYLQYTLLYSLVRLQSLPQM